ncbi:hypothetical protein Hbut_0937 [Hyperthermus butylicus DSM 5456]|uniref:Uncharacterized protein n=1 Tax=Hyperthermus butylicus (strain DSM 5456 / JCM 9403 / PLM1-5) TaxID=415426 RepID=A2BLC4_HYPBU|nr:hypothetical protein Hbut_0937 [Hyperthermus butylicus DSM 5456]
MHTYIVVCGGKPYMVVGSLLDALAKASEECSGESTEIYKAKLIVELDPEDLREIRESLSRRAAAGPAPAKTEKAAGYAVVFDQMFKGFAEILARELHDMPLEFHEVLGRGIDRPIRIAPGVYQQPARDDYDVLSLLERLANQYRGVIFFTGDKKLAMQARLIPGVDVEYLPPGEVAGKEMALKLMASRIRELVRR